MKLITKKQAKIISDAAGNSLLNVLSAHGIRPKVVLINRFKDDLNKSLGGGKYEFSCSKKKI